VRAWRSHPGPEGPAGRLLAELRPHVADPRVLAAIGEVPRDEFVPARRSERAWDNVALPIGAGQTISQPLVVARMCELLALRGDERVLDVGTGSGYHAAVLARLVAHVWTVELLPALSERAAGHLAAAGAANVTLLVGDGSLGHPGAAPYDAINVAATMEGDVPPALVEQLAPGGRLVGPVDAGDQRLVLLRRGAGGELHREQHERVRFVPLLSGPG
jgi:protein-L-isoaspartate(D-aspartate) O-methyltransferase